MAAVLERLKRNGAVMAGLAVLALIVLLQLAQTAPLERLQLQVFDSYQRAAPRVQAGASPVVVVDIDEASITHLGQWPWPRTDLAELTRRLGQAGAAAVAFDIVLSEADRTSPEALMERLGPAGQALAGLPSNDALLAQSFADVPAVTAFFLDKARSGRVVEPKFSFTLHGSMPTAAVQSYQGSLQPLPVLEAAAAGNGFVTLEADADGIVRRVPLVAIHRGVLIPSLGLEAVRVALDAGSPDLTTTDGSGETVGAGGAAVSLRLIERHIPLTDAGEMWLHFPVDGQRITLPAWQIIGGELSDAALAEAVRGRIVFIGGSAVGLQDLISTPVSDRTAGVNAHAVAAEQILAGDFLERPDWAVGLELVLMLLLGGALALLVPRLGAGLGALAALVGIGAAAGGSWLAFTQADYLLDPTYLVLALAAIYAVQTVAVFWREEQKRRYIHAAFDRFLSPEMVRQIAADPGRLELGGEERDMSVLMADIRGFSRISEQFSPRQVIDFLITFLTPMSEILLARRATLDKYIGDAVLAFWNAPLDDPDHHANAASAALEMIARTAQLNVELGGREGVTWPGEVKIGIGLNSGLCCVGNMGSAQRLSYTLIGDTVNVASRLEGLTKQYGVSIMIGGTLAGHLPGFALLEVDHVRVVGRDAPARIFTLLGDEAVAARADFVRLAEGHTALLSAYRAQDWEAAEAALGRGQADYATFGVAALAELFARRVERLRADPPGPGWDGVFSATEK